jgi:hypothetical protein
MEVEQVMMELPVVPILERAVLGQDLLITVFLVDQV